jgi:CHAD domain-containing protein
MLDILKPAISTLRDDQNSVSEIVHATRRTTKQVRALLKLAPAQLKDQSRMIRANLRQSRKALGPARDARVAYDLLADKLGHQNQTTENAPQLLVNLQRICEDIETRTRAQIFKIVIADLHSTARQISDWPSQELNPSELIKRISSGYQQARKLRPRKSGNIDLHSLHGFRSALVDHYYQLDFLNLSDTRKIAKRKARLKDLRTQLGLYLDHRHLHALAEQHSSQHLLSSARDKDQSLAKILPRLIKEAREIFDPSPDDMIASVSD